MRFTFIKMVSFDHPDEHTQVMSVYWDEKVGAPIALDNSFIEQSEGFSHPYSGEFIKFDNYSEF